MSSFTLKIIALLCMVIDHIGYFFLTEHNFYLLYRMIGRFSAPIFLYLLVEGFLKSKNRKKYKFRLLNYSILMFIGTYFLSLYCKNIYPLNTNILFTMFIGFLCLECLENIKEKKINLVYLSLLFILFYFVEYSYLALLNIIIFYSYHKLKIFNKTQKKILLTICFIFSNMIYCILTKNIIQMTMIFAIIPILLYNEKLGYKNKFIKYFFYIFYILHLWVFVILINL